jgi:hypothetical protein
LKVLQQEAPNSTHTGNSVKRHLAMQRRTVQKPGDSAKQRDIKNSESSHSHANQWPKFNLIILLDSSVAELLRTKPRIQKKKKKDWHGEFIISQYTYHYSL